MILVSLLDLVQVPDTEHLWPEEFRQLVQSYEEARKPKPRPTDESDTNGTRTAQEVEDRCWIKN
jgi:hypothetical protein